MIVSKDGTKYRQLEYQGDKFRMFHAELIPDGFLKANHELRKNKLSTMSADGEFMLVARVPTLLWIKWKREHPELSDPDPDYRDRFLWKLLRKEENEVFRTAAV